MENIINNPGLQHIAENIFCNLSDKDIKICQEINQSCKQILESPLFWKAKFMRQLSKNNQNDWNEAIQKTKNTDLENNILLYMKNTSKYNMDIPCYITNDTLLKYSSMVQEYMASTLYSFLDMVTRAKQNDDADAAGCIQALGSIMPNPNATNRADGWTPIHEAASCGKSEIVKILAPLTVNPNAPFTDGRTPISTAAFNGHVEIVKILAPLTVNPNAPDDNGKTPIYLAARKGHTEIVQILVPLTYDPNAPDKDGWTPIHGAACNGHTEIVKILAPLTDNPNAIRDHLGRTPIYWAASNGHTEIVIKNCHAKLS